MSRAYFNERADIWDEKIAEKDHAKLERMAGRLNIEPDATVLDIGTGTGVLLPYLLKKVGLRGKVVALDIAEKMLSKAKTKGFDARIIYLCADVMAIPLDDEYCDAVVCYSSLPHFPDKLKALLEIRRTLKKGGRIFICHTSSREQINKIHRSLPMVHNDLLPDAIEMATLLQDAGLTEIKVEDTSEYYFASASTPASATV